MDTFESKGGYLLAGSAEEEEGGLVTAKPSKEQEFKKPGVSLLGLDVLARKKRDESNRAVQQGRSSSERRKDEAADEKDDVPYFDSRISFGKSRERQYRVQQSETPSHTGGVSEEAVKRSRERRDREREQGLHASSKELERKRYHDRLGKDGDSDRKRSKDDSDYRRRDREGWRRGREARGESERRREGDSSEWRSRREGGWSSRSQRSVRSWEETPEREVEGECASGSLAYCSSLSFSQCDLYHIDINIIVIFKYVERQMRIDCTHLNLSNQVSHLSNQASYVRTNLIRSLYETATSLVATPHGHHRSRNLFYSSAKLPPP